jgi:hypothetical protein
MPSSLHFGIGGRPISGTSLSGHNKALAEAQPGGFCLPAYIACVAGASNNRVCPGKTSDYIYGRDTNFMFAHSLYVLQSTRKDCTKTKTFV